MYQNYPYDYIDGFEKIDESVPGKDKFYNLLTKYEITDKNYENI